mmetsp:Transcript_25856/g.83737  ORF Transcript_25856/g.83737 Transcript_25856/m.83737 type:complete len:484 (+) Transcript_25856:117-1568(+)
MDSSATDEEMTREKALALYSSIDWSSYGRVGILGGGDVDVLRVAENAPLDYTLKDDTAATKFASSLLKVVANVSDVPALQYTLTRIEDVLLFSDDNGLTLAKRVSLFENFDDAALLRCLTHTKDAYCAKVCACVLATFLTVLENSSCEPFVSWLCEQLSASRSAKVSAAVPALTILLRAIRARDVFADHGGVGYLTKLLKRSISSSSAGSSSSEQQQQQGPASTTTSPPATTVPPAASTTAQMQYELTFCLWTLSLEFRNSARIAGDFASCATVEVVSDQIAAAPREKVLRVSLATLRNLCLGVVLSSTEGVASKMIKAGLPKTLRTLRERPFTDPDVKDDVEHLSKILATNYRELSTFERYVAELDSGDLQWASLCHSESFWKENAKLAEADDFKLIKQLVTIVKAALDAANDDPDVPKNAAIACSDLGDFVRFYPNGKAVIKHLGAKDYIMKLIDHHDPDVQRHALQCVSKLLVTNWQFVK